MHSQAQASLTAMPTSDLFSSALPVGMAEMIAAQLQLKADTLVGPIKNFNTVVTTIIDLKKQIFDLRQERQDLLELPEFQELRNYVQSFSREYRKLMSWIDVEDNPNLYLNQLPHFLVRSIQRNIRRHLTKPPLGNRLSALIDLNILDYDALRNIETFTLNVLLVQIKNAVTKLLVEVGVNEAVEITRRIFEANYLLLEPEVFLDEDFVHSEPSLDEAEWLYLFDLASLSHLANVQDDLNREANHLRAHLESYTTILTLIPVIRNTYLEQANDVNSNDEFPGFILEIFYLYVLPVRIELALEYPELFVNAKNRFENFNIRLEELDIDIPRKVHNVSVYMQDNYKTKLDFFKNIDLKLLNHIRYTVYRANKLYKPERALKRGGFFYRLFHRGYGLTRADDLQATMRDMDSSRIQRIRNLASRLTDQRSTGGLRANSFDTILLMLLYNEVTPHGLFGINALEDIDPPRQAHNAGGLDGSITLFMKKGPRRLNSADRNVIRLGTQIMLFKVCDEVDASKANLEVLQKYLSP
jgi:hypothetical protein